MASDDQSQPEVNADTAAAPQKSAARRRADEIRNFRCRNVIAVLERPADPMNIAAVIRNVNALGVEKVYVVDPRKSLPDDWQELRERREYLKLSVSATKWTFVRRFDDTDSCFDYLEQKNFTSIATSPHVKGKQSSYLHETDFTPYPKLAIWFGTEGPGLTARAIERSAACVSIPMFGMVESFNLGTSSGIVLYEVAKQRRAYQSQFRRRHRKQAREVPLPTVMPPRILKGRSP